MLGRGLKLAALAATGFGVWMLAFAFAGVENANAGPPEKKEKKAAAIRYEIATSGRLCGWNEGKAGMFVVNNADEYIMAWKRIEMDGQRLVVPPYDPGSIYFFVFGGAVSLKPGTPLKIYGVDYSASDNKLAVTASTERPFHPGVSITLYDPESPYALVRVRKADLVGRLNRQTVYRLNEVSLIVHGPTNLHDVGILP